MKRAIFLLPLALFLGVAAFLYRGLFLDPAELPSALIGKPFPAFSLPAVQEPERTLTVEDLKGKPALVNVWATWCVSCKVEHPVLNELAGRGVNIVGVNYKDDNASALKWLKEFHDPTGSTSATSRAAWGSTSASTARRKPSSSTGTASSATSSSG